MAIHATYQGIEFDLHDERMQTWDAFELVTDAQDGNGRAVIKLVRLAFGEEQFDRIKRELPDNSITTVVGFLTGAFQAAAAAKGENPKN